MAKDVTGVDELQEYMNGVVERADHHGHNVNEIVFALVGAVISYKDPEPIEVRGREGALKNVLWVTINGKRYVLSFQHKTGEIELRRESLRGAVVHSFSNSTPISEVKRVFKSL
jgi:hypothetical protein